MEIFKEFTFDSAHFLPNVPDGHKCYHMHGHTYKVKIVVEGEVDPHFGWVIDFGDIKVAFKPLIDQMDHHVLNEIKGLENPTAENIAQWIWIQLKPHLPLLSRIEIYETPTSGCVYRGPVYTLKKYTSA